MELINDRCLLDNIFDKYKLSIDFIPKWSDCRQANFIESIIMNIPIIPIILEETVYPNFKIIDGNERLLAIRRFISNELFLEKLYYKKELNGLYYKDLPENIVKKTKWRYIPFSIMKFEENDNVDEYISKIRAHWCHDYKKY